MRVIVMGGTSGIGRATAQRLADRGADVVVTGRDPDRLARVSTAGVARAERVDGTDDEAVRAFFADEGEFDHLVLCFSPGAVGVGPVRELPADAVTAAVSDKLLGYLSAIRHARVTGSVTMISAASARSAAPQTAVLAAVNGAIERMVSPLAAELSPVRVNAVSPGVIDTPWWSFLPDDARAAQFSEWTAQQPVARVGTADDVAGAVVYLIGADYVTGSVLPVDGGLTVA